MVSRWKDSGEITVHDKLLILTKYTGVNMGQKFFALNSRGLMKLSERPCVMILEINKDAGDESPDGDIKSIHLVHGLTNLKPWKCS